MTPLQHPAAYWTAQNIILEAGRTGRETDTGLIKIGDGLLPWNELAYYDFLNQYTPATGINTYVATYQGPLVLGYFIGMPLRVLFASANTGASTINFNGFGAVPLRKQGTVALSAGDIGAGTIHTMVYDGTNFQITSLIGGGGTVGPGTVNRVPKFTSANTIGDTSIIAEVGGSVGIGTATPANRLHVVGVGDPGGTHFRVDNAGVIQLFNVTGRWTAVGALATSAAAFTVNTAGLATSVGIRENSSSATTAIVIQKVAGSTGTLGLISNTNTTFGIAGNVLDVFQSATVGINIPLQLSAGQGGAGGFNGMGVGLLFAGNTGVLESSTLRGSLGRIYAMFVTDATKSALVFEARQASVLAEVGRFDHTGSFITGGTVIGASVKLQIDSTTKGFLPPRMTNAQRLAIPAPAIGLIVYCTDLVEGLYINKSLGWTFII